MEINENVENDALLQAILSTDIYLQNSLFGRTIII